MDNSGLKIPAKWSTLSCMQRTDGLREKQGPKEPMVQWYPGGKSCRRRTNAVAPLGSSRKPASRIPTLPPFNKKSVSDSSGVPPRLYAPLHCATPNVTRQPGSKLPVPKKPTRLAPIPNSYIKNASVENNLSAAARRQKYHQSRHPGKLDNIANNISELPVTFRVTGPSDKSCSSFRPPSIVTTTEHSNCTENLLNSVQIRDRTVQNLHRNIIHVTTVLPSVVQKQVLPPVSVKTSASSGARTENQQTKKKKNLLGEFTHFPAVCNIIPSKTTKILSISTVPSLPPILPPPPAPPPSISASLEQETVCKSKSGEKKMESLNSPESSANIESVMISDDVPSAESDISSTTVTPERRRTPFVHTISIVIEPVDIEISDTENGTTPTNVEMDNIAMKSDASENIVKTVMDLARLRKEEFARLLEEHAQIVREIKRAETMKM